MKMFTEHSMQYALINCLLEPIAISSSEDAVDWFYHRVEWHDMDNDGDLDAVTARAYGSGGKCSTDRQENLNYSMDS